MYIYVYHTCTYIHALIHIDTYTHTCTCMYQHEAAWQLESMNRLICMEQIHMCVKVAQRMEVH